MNNETIEMMFEQSDLFAESAGETAMPSTYQPMSEQDFWQDLREDKGLADGAARFQAIDPFDSYIVQAPAGSGKTALLTQRFLALLSTVDQPEKVVAMTFTKKAAAEMRERVMKALQSGQREAPEESDVFAYNTWLLATRVLQQDARHEWNLLQNPNRLRVKTIDGLNGFLAGQMPLLSRLGSSPKMSDNPNKLYLEAARQALKDSDQQQAVASLLRLVNGRYAKAERLLVNMLQKRDQWIAPLLSARGGLARERLQQAWYQLVLAEMKQPCAQLRSVANELEEIVSLADYAVDNGYEAAAPLVGAWPLKTNVESLPLWRTLANWVLTGNDTLRKSVTKAVGFPPGSATEKEKKAQFQNVLAELREGLYHQAVEESLALLKEMPDPEYSEEQWETLESLIHLLLAAASHLKLVFSDTGETDFIEVAQAASQALGSELEPTELAQRLDYQIEHLLVDEFQDTSSEQFALIHKLVASWQPEEGKTLFLVGDPMQSIYRFREAEVGNFLQAWEQGVADVALQPLNLSVNFRSTAGLVNWVNQTFKQVFPKQNQLESGAVAFTDAVAFSKDESEAVQTLWHIEQTPADEVRSLVEHIANYVADDDNAKRTLAILGRSRSHLMPIALALKSQGLAFRAVELEGLQERQEIQDCLALGQALLHLADRPAWIALLRSPLVGLSLTDLHGLMGESPYELVWTLLLKQSEASNSLSAEGLARLQRVLPVLEMALQHLHERPFSELLKGCWLQLGGAQTVESEVALQNVEMLCFSLMQFDHDVLDATRLAEIIEQLFAKPDASEASQQLELMTMHKSKGLQFDTVILPSLGRKPRSSDSELLAWMTFASTDPLDTLGMNEQLVIAPLDQQGQEPSLLRGLLKRFDDLKEQYETARLLYVAATRAERQLICSGSIPFSDKADAKPKPHNASLLQALWPAVKTEFQKKFAEYEPSEEAILESSSEPKVSRLPLDVSSLSDQIAGEYGNQTTQVCEHERALQESVQNVPELYLAQSAQAKLEAHVSSVLDDSVRALLNTSVGNCVHKVLELAVDGGPLQMDDARISSWLQQQGLGQQSLAEGVQRVQRSLRHAAANETVCWALKSDHACSATEYALTSYEQNEVLHHIVDRTFVDEEGVRWIVDYKTSLYHRSSGRVEDFIIKQVEQYQPQLERYGRLLQSMDAQQGQSRAQRWALYFSDCDVWQEVASSV